MATATPRPRPRSPQAGSLPPIETGDHLSRSEFERRYEATPDIKKAELIEGVVYVASPVRFFSHGQPHAQILVWLGTYQASTPGVFLGDNSTIRLDLDNEPQPDALLMIDPALGGQARIGPDDIIEGPPELVVEVASSSASHDLHTKLNVYRRNGVREYLVWRVLDHAIDWFLHRDGQYVALAPDDTGILKSESFPGLWLNREALLKGDLPVVLDTLRQGLASPDHASFLTRLASPQASPDSTR